MAGGKLSARQKMINMMYLVLTAMLALNVSKEILKAFHLMEVSFNKANENVDKKNINIMKALAEQAKNRPEEVKPFHDRALRVKATSEKFVNYIENLKKTLIAQTDGRKKPTDGELPTETELEEADNIELHAHYFFKNPNDKNAKDLTKMVDDTRSQFLDFLKDGSGVKIDQADRTKMQNYANLKTNYDKSKYPSWAVMYFEHSPLAAVITMLTKIQNDCRNTEADIIEMLAKNIDATKISFDLLEAKVIPSSTAVQVGSEYKAEVILVASNSKSDNPVYVNGNQLPMEKGKGIYTARPQNQGVFTWKGTIEVKTAKGNVSYPFEQEYQAFEGGATISADAMNVLYIALDNPVSIAVSGFAPNDVTATMTNGSLSRTGKGYIAKVSAVNPAGATISVSVKMKDGTSRNMGSKMYRIKSVPKPESFFGTLESGIHPAAALLGQSTIRGVLANFVFDGISFTVNSYNALYVPKRGLPEPVTGTSATITQQLKACITKSKRGDKILVDDIQATGPFGIKKRLGPIAITIQ